nr:serine-rich adhesin for platelets isoform X2 [Hydra vulgaris]
MIILTDGNANIGNSKNFSNGPKDLAVAAKLARDFDITVFAVAVGSKINMQYLLLITNDTNKVIKSSSFDQLLKTSPLKNLFPNCIFNTTASTNIISSQNSTSYATQTTKVENISTTLISNLSKFTTKNNEILDKTKNLINQITTTFKSNPIPVTRSTFKQLTAQSATTSETTPKKQATSTDSYNISSTLIFSGSEPSTHTTKQSITTEEEAANISSAPSSESSPATVTSFLSEKSTKQSATWSIPQTKMLATSTESENISSTLIFTGSESLTHSAEQLVTTEEIANTSSAPSFESTPKHVPGSTSKQLTKESATSTKTTPKKPATSTELENVSTTLMFTGSEPSTRTTEQSITTEEEAANTSSAPSSESNPATVTSFLSEKSTKQSATWSIPQTKMLATSTESENISSTLIFTGSISLTHSTEQLVTTEEIANTSSAPSFESTPKHVTGSTSKQLTKESATSTKTTPKKPATSTELENVSTTLMFTGSEPSTRTSEQSVTTEEEAANTSSAPSSESSPVTVSSFSSKTSTKVTATWSESKTKMPATSTESENISSTLIFTGSESLTHSTEELVTTEEIANTSSAPSFESTPKHVTGSTSKQLTKESATSTKTTPKKPATSTELENVSTTLMFTGSEPSTRTSEQSITTEEEAANISSTPSSESSPATVTSFLSEKSTKQSATWSIPQTKMLATSTESENISSTLIFTGSESLTHSTEQLVTTEEISNTRSAPSFESIPKHVTGSTSKQLTKESATSTKTTPKKPATSTELENVSTTLMFTGSEPSTRTSEQSITTEEEAANISSTPSSESSPATVTSFLSEKSTKQSATWSIPQTKMLATSTESENISSTLIFTGSESLTHSTEQLVTTEEIANTSSAPSFKSTPKHVTGSTSKKLTKESATSTKTTPKKPATLTELENLSTTLIFTGSEPSTRTSEQSVTTEEEAANISSKPSSDSSSATVTSFLSEKSTKQSATWSIPQTKMLATSTESENISSTLIFTGSESLTHSTEQLVTTEEIANTSSAPSFESTPKHVTGSTPKHLTKESATSTKTAPKKPATSTELENVSTTLMFTGSEPSTRTTEQFNTTEEATNTSSVEPTEVLRLSTESYVSSSSIPFSKNCRYEVAFVLDASDSINPTTFNDEKLFVGNLVKNLGISENGNKVSVVLFSSKATEAIYCDEYQDEKLFNRALKNLTQSGQYTNIEDGVDKGKNILQKRGCGVQADALKLMVVFTDGAANIGNSVNPMNGSQDLANAAKSARYSGIKIIAVAVGKKVESDVLLALTNDSNLIVKAYNFSLLEKKHIWQNIVSSLCNNHPITEVTPKPLTRAEPLTTKPKLIPTKNNVEELTVSSQLPNTFSKQSTKEIQTTQITKNSQLLTATTEMVTTSTELENLSTTLNFTGSEPSTRTSEQSVTTEEEAANTSSAPSSESSPVTVSSFSSKTSTKVTATWSESKTKMPATSTESENISSTLIFTGSESLTHSTEELVTTEEIANTSSAPSFESTPKHVTGSTSKQLTKESATSTKTTPKKPATSTELENVSTTLMFTGSEPSTRTTEQSITTEEEAANISSTPSSESSPVTVTSFFSKTSTKESATWSEPKTKMPATSTESENISSTLIFTRSESLTHSTEQLVTTEEIANTSSAPSFESTPKHVTGSTPKQLTKESATSTKTTPRKPATLTYSDNISSTLIFTGSEPSTRTTEQFNTTEETTNTSSVETTEVLRLSTESYLSSSSIPFSKNCRYEVAFVLDASESINPTTFNDEKLFVGNLVKNLGISENGNKVSVVLFSSKATEAIYCDEYQDEKLFNRALKNLTQNGQFTNIEDGVDKGKNILQKRGCGVQADALKLMVVFTDGAANIGNSVNPMNGSQDLANAAKSARYSGIKIIAVAVGKKVESDVLLALTNDSNLIVKAYNFSLLEKKHIWQNIVSSLCNNHPITKVTPKPLTRAEPLTTKPKLIPTKNNVEELTVSSQLPNTFSKQSTKEIQTTQITKNSQLLTATTEIVTTSTELENLSTTLNFTGSKPSTRTSEQSVTTEEEAANTSSAPSSESSPVTVSSFSSKTSTKVTATWSESKTKMPATSTESENISSTLIFTGSESLTHSTEQLVTTEEIANTSSASSFKSTPKHVTGSTLKQLTKESATSTKTTPKKPATSTELENISTTIMFTGSEPSTRTTEQFNTTEEATNTSSVETTEVLRLSTESYVSSSSIPFSKNCRYEVAFVLDASDSINLTTFNDEKLFVGNLVKNLGISENGNKVSVVLFSSKATEAIYCDEYQDEKLFNRALKNLTQSGQFTNIEDGVDKGKNILQKRGCGVQADALKLMVVFTDGAANIGNSVNPMNGSQDLANAAKSARDYGIKIIVVAVGKKVESDVLLALTNDTYLIVKGYSFNMLLENRFMKSISEFCLNKATRLFTGTKTVPFETSTFSSLENNFTFSSQVSTFESHISTKVDLNTTVSTGACDDLCRCLFNVSSFPKLELSKSDIEAMFNGTCFNDKLLASIKYVSSMTGSILFKKYSLETCRDKIRIKIKKKDEACVDKLLDRFSECNIVIDCKIKDFYERAKQSKKFLENLVKFSEKSYDIFTGLSNLMKWIGL